LLNPALTGTAQFQDKIYNINFFLLLLSQKRQNNLVVDINIKIKVTRISIKNKLKNEKCREVNVM